MTEEIQEIIDLLDVVDVPFVALKVDFTLEIRELLINLMAVYESGQRVIDCCIDDGDHVSLSKGPAVELERAIAAVLEEQEQ